MTYDRLLNLLKQAKATFDPFADADVLRNLSDDEFDILVTDFAEFRNALLSAANYLAVLRQQRT
jgi:hypothetical protein